MEFRFETNYDLKALTAMAKAIRKTIRKKHSRRSHIFGWIVTALALLLILPLGDDPFVLNFNTVITGLAALAILFTLVFEDKINGYVAKKRMPVGTDKAVAVFTPENYISTTELGKSEFSYDKIALLAETKDYFVFIIDASHAQIYAKNSIAGGTVGEFREFIGTVTQKQILMVK